MSKFFEIGQETKFSPELAHMAYDMNDVQPFSEKKGPDGSAVRYMTITPPSDGTYSRGDGCYIETLAEDYFPLKKAEFPPIEQNIGVVPYFREVSKHPLHVEKKFGLSGYYGWRSRAPHNDHLIESTGGIRPAAHKLYHERVVVPFATVGSICMAWAIGAEFYQRVWRNVLSFPSPKAIGGLPGCVAILGAIAWHKRKTPGAFECDFRRLEESAKYHEVIHERKDLRKEAWEEHKASKNGWWSTAE